MDVSRALLVLLLFSGGAQLSRACGNTAHRFGSGQDSHLCFECRGLGNHCPVKPVICPIGFHKCMSATSILQIGDTAIKMKQRECIKECEDSSLNNGLLKQTFSCCDTDFCNSRDAPDPNTNAPNGRTCYYCKGRDCSNTISCSGTEDRCITATMTNGGFTMLVKGCASRFICGALTCSFIRDVSCCEGDLCNGDKNITQRFRSNAEESVTQSILQSFVYTGATSVTEKPADDHTTSATVTYNHDERVGQRVTYSSAESVEQSFLFLCCPLLSYFLWL